MSDVRIVEIRPIGEFDFRWPDADEHCEHGWEGMARDVDRTFTFRVGLAARIAYGRPRTRVVTWINGGTGAGLSDSQLLHAWSGSGGLLGTRTRGWRLLDPQNVAGIKKAIKASGAIYAGIVLPSAGVVGTTIDPTLTADSQVAGHGLAIFGWTPSGFLGISWGEVVLLPYAWWTQFSTTAYAVNIIRKS